ncbi:MAG TPA: OmpA family protein, partial [Burkholderiales bacterium]
MMKRITVLALLAFIAACSSTPDKEQTAAAVEDRSPGAKPSDKPGTGAEATPLKPGGVGGNPLTDPASPLSKRSVFFDFDSFVIKDDFKSLIQAHAQYLKQNGKAKVILQGNADERGSREYNLALGQKRADAVKKALEVLGVKDAQVESVSFGEEKPRSTGHDE